MANTLGLLEEAMQLARDLGYRVREEALGELPGGMCIVAGVRQILLNADLSAADRLAALVEVLAADPAVAQEPVSRPLETRLRGARGGG